MSPRQYANIAWSASPVVTSAQAMMWQGLRMAGVATGEVVAFGRLFQAEADPTISARQPALQGML